MLETYWPAFGLTALTAMAFFMLLGSALATRALSGLPPLVRGLLAPLLGFGAWTGFSVALFYVIPFSAGRAAGLAAVTLVVAWALARPVRVGSPRTLAAVGALCGLIAFLPVLPITPVEYRDGLFFAEPIFDHMKVALVDAIYRHGVPPLSPYYAPGGQPVALNYYFGWYVVAAALRVLPNVSGLVADAALTYCTAWISLSAIAGLAVLLAGKTRAAFLAPLVAVPIGLDEALRWMFGTPYLDFIGTEHGLENWLIQATWVPQHLFSGVTIVLIILLIVELIQNSTARWVIAPLLGLLASAAVVSSIWAGAFGLGGAFVPILVAVLATSQARARWRAALGPVVVTLAVAGITVAPFIRNLLSFESPNSKSPIGFWLWPTLRDPPRDVFGYVWHFVAYWTFYACIQFGAIYLVGWIGLLTGRDGLWSNARLFRRLSIAVIVANLTVAQFVKSVIVNNDLGWRVVLPAMLLLVVWTTATLSRWVDTLRHSRQGAAFHRALLGVVGTTLLASVGFVSSMRFATAAFSGRDRDRTEPSLKRDLQRMPEAWETVRRFTTPRDVVAMNPVSFERITSWEANAAAALFSDRLQVLSDSNWPMVYSHHVDRRKFHVDLEFMRHIFNEEASSEDLKRLALDFRVRALLVFPRDSLWQNPTLSANDYYKEAYGSKHYRVYVRKD